MELGCLLQKERGELTSEVGCTAVPWVEIQEEAGRALPTGDWQPP